MLVHVWTQGIYQVGQAHVGDHVIILPAHPTDRLILPINQPFTEKVSN